MIGSHLRASLVTLFGSLLLAALPCALLAFPPAPFFTLHGMVRDEQGNALDVDGASIVLLKNGAEVLRGPIRTNRLPDQNYQFRLRMDMQRPGTASYSSLISGTGAAFTLGVVLNNITYYPIEMSTPRSVGKPGERVRLDLTLGVDSDGDGLPDAWEQTQLFAGGVVPDDDGWDLTLIDRNGDFDGDGISNWVEYIAGTFATDPTDYLALQVAGSGPGFLQLRFFGIYSKVYSLESSTDLQTWSPAAFFLSEPPPSVPENDPQGSEGTPAPQATLRAEATHFIDLYAPADAEGRTFYRLKVR